MSWRLLALVLAVALAAAVGTLLLLSRTTGVALTRAGLDEAHARWRDHGPRSYRIEVVTAGARPATHAVEVRDGEVVSATTDGRSVPERTRGTWSVPGLFRLLEVELSNASRPRVPYGVEDPDDVILRVAFHETHGYPRSFLRHVMGQVADVEWEVRVFEPREPP